MTDLAPGPATHDRDREKRFVFTFAEGAHEESSTLGGKGAALCRLTSLGLPVPPGFIASCAAGRAYLEQGRLPDQVRSEVSAALDALEASTGRRLGDSADPLLVSVRSGAPVSMPGMMDTLLNVGMNEVTVRALAEDTGDAAFAWGCYERFVDAYARVVSGVSPAAIEELHLALPSGLDDSTRSQQVVSAVRALCDEHGQPIPAEPRRQVFAALEAVFQSWASPRAAAYRRFKGIADDLGTAGTVQAMVFGNRDDRSASGVAFSRDPSSGRPGAFGDVLFRAQGEDVVSGDFDAEPLTALADRLPEVYGQLREALDVVETELTDLVELEFTVERGRLWVLQARVGQRSGPAAVRVACALADEGMIAIDAALRRVAPSQLQAAVSPRFADGGDSLPPLAVGLPGAPGAAVGVAAFDPDRAAELAAAGSDVVLIRPTTSPSDVAGFIAARAVVTGRGGRTSHAAVVARGMGRAAVCGVGKVEVSPDGRSATVNGQVVHEGHLLSVDGDAGTVEHGARDLAADHADPDVSRFVAWCRSHARVPVVDIAPDPLELADPAALPPARLLVVLRERDEAGAPAVVAVHQAWARAADRPLRGPAAGVQVVDAPEVALLLAATLDPALPR